MSDYSKLSLDAELEAVSIIGQYIGDEGSVVHKGKTDPYDFEIHYNDSRVAIGEVSILEDENYRSWIDAISKLENNYSIPLPAGLGVWQVSLKISARQNKFRREIRSFVELLDSQRIYDLHLWADWPIDDISAKARNLGISHINKVHNLEGDLLIWGSEGSGGVLQDQAEPLVAEMETLLHGGNFQTSWTKLIPYPADEKHIFFKCGSLISYFLLEYLRPPHDQPLTADFKFPEGITHFWLTSELQGSATLLWVSDGQKKRMYIPVPQMLPDQPISPNISGEN